MRLDAMQAMHLQLQDLNRAAEQLLRVHRDSLAAQKDVKVLEAELASSGSLKTMSDVQQQQQELQSKNEALTVRMDGLRERIHFAQNEIHRRKNRCHELRQSLVSFQLNRQKADHLNAQLSDLRTQANAIDGELAELVRSLEPLAECLQTLVTERQNMRVEFDRQMASLQDTANQLHQDLTLLASKHREVESRKVDDAQLREAESAIRDLEERRIALQQRSAGLAEEMQLLGRQLSEVEGLKRSINDNLKYRELKAQVAAFDVTIQALRSQVGDSSKISDLETLRQQRAELTSKKDRLLGQQKALTEQVLRLERELEVKPYKGIEEDYRQLQIDIRLTELAVGDLDKYVKALDNAIIKYHSIKMEEINKIIAELWSNTYKGNGRPFARF